MKNKKAFFWGALFGLIAPIIGLFAGLQIAPIVGNILMFPFIIISHILDKPFGEFPTPLLVLSIVLSILAWGAIFSLIARLRK
jgi:hypothetical protein